MVGIGLGRAPRLDAQLRARRKAFAAVEWGAVQLGRPKIVGLPVSADFRGEEITDLDPRKANVRTVVGQQQKRMWLVRSVISRCKRIFVFLTDRDTQCAHDRSGASRSIARPGACAAASRACAAAARAGTSTCWLRIIVRNLATGSAYLRCRNDWWGATPIDDAWTWNGARLARYAAATSDRLAAGASGKRGPRAVDADKKQGAQPRASDRLFVHRLVSSDDMPRELAPYETGTSSVNFRPAALPKLKKCGVAVCDQQIGDRNYSPG